MSLNFAGIYVEAVEPTVLTLLDEIIDQYVTEYFDKILKYDQSMLIEAGDSLYLNQDLERELLTTPITEGWIGIFDDSGVGTDPKLAQTLSQRLGCKVIWLEFIEQTFSLLVYEFNIGMMKALVHEPEKYAREGLKEFFRSNGVDFYEQVSKVFNYNPINEIAKEYFENSQIPAKLRNLVKTSEESEIIGKCRIINNNDVTFESVHFKVAVDPWNKLLHLDKFVLRQEHDTANKFSSVNVETRIIPGVIATKSALERIYELEEKWRKKIFFAFYMHKDEIYLPEVFFKYESSSDISELIENEKASSEFGYWQLTGKKSLLTMPAFLKIVTRWLKEVFPYLNFEECENDCSINWEISDNGQKMTAYIDNLYYKYLLKNPDEDTNKILAAHFEPVFKMPMDFDEKDGIDIDPGSEIKDYFDLRLLNEHTLDASFNNFVYQYYVEGIRAYIGFSTGYGTFRYVKESDLGKWGFTYDEALGFALENIRSRFLNFEDHLIPIYDKISQVTYFKLFQQSKIETGMVLLPEFTSMITKILGQNFYLGMPNRDYLYIYPDADAKFLRARKRELDFLYHIAPYPISPEIMLIDETGISVKKIERIFNLRES